MSSIAGVNLFQRQHEFICEVVYNIL